MFDFSFLYIIIYKVLYSLVSFVLLRIFPCCAWLCHGVTRPAVLSPVVSRCALLCGVVARRADRVVSRRAVLIRVVSCHA